MSKACLALSFVLLASLAEAKVCGFEQNEIPAPGVVRQWLQNVYTNRFTVMCETKGDIGDLELLYGPDFRLVAPVERWNGLKDGTFVCRAEVEGLAAAGETVQYCFATNLVPLAGTEGAVTLWKDEDSAFTCAIWGDNQEGVQKYDWGLDDADERYRCIRSMFGHMAGQKPDFGFTTGDMSSDALYDDEILPGELRGAADLFGNKIPYHLVWGNHDCVGTFLGEVYTNAAQRYFSPAASEEEGWFHLYRNNVLFVGVHWTWGQDDAEERYAKIAQGVEELLKTDRAKNAKFRILVQHAPIFLECYNVLPKLDWFSDSRLLDVAKAGGVDVVFSGHTHAYERIERDGLVQVVNGGMGYLDHGERWYNNYGSDAKVGGHQNTPLLWARQDEGGGLAAAQPVRMGCFQGYGMLSVEGDTLTYRAHAFDADGGYIGVADSFTLESKSAVTHGTSGTTGTLPFTPAALTAPVDNATWKAYKDAQGEAWEIPAGQAGSDPVVNVSKMEIERFCAALNAGAQHDYRLPTVQELTEAYGGDLRRDVSEWTCDVDPNSGWCRILGGNGRAVDHTWCRAYDKPAMATPGCHANYLGFRVVDAPAPSAEASAMDKALAALAEIEAPAEVYKWDPDAESLVDITEDWNALMWKKEDYDYTAPVIFTGAGDLTYRVRTAVTFGGGLAAPKATSLDLSHVLDLGLVSEPVTVRGEFRGGVAPDEWRFYLKCDELTLDNVTYRGQVFNAVTDSRALNLVGTNDFSGAVMSICVDRLLADPSEDFVTNLVADAAATLWLRRLDFSTRGVVEEVLGTLVETACFTVGANVTLATSEDVLFGIKGATLTVDGALDAAGVDIAGHLLGLLPQEATVSGSGAVRTTHFGMCDKSTLYVGVPNVTLLSSVPYRSYSDPASGCDVKPVPVDPSGNPMRYFSPEDAVSYTNCVWSLKNLQRGELYSMTWDRDADYHLERVLGSGLTDGMSVMGFLCTNVLDKAPRPTVAGFPGCTAFMATNAAGEHLVGRNLDYALPMAHVLLFVPKNPALNRKYSSVGTVDAGWVGYDAGQFDDGKTDLSYAALFPYYCMDGMNEKGVMVTILSLDARRRPSTGAKDWMIEQFYPDRPNVVLSLAIRYLLDNAGTAAEGVQLMENFNVFAAIGGDLGIVGNYHLYICDPSGDTRTVEWMPPDQEGGSWQLREVKGATAISNFHLTDGYGHGSNRWEIARHALAQQGGHLEADDAMNLCRAASQRKGTEMTSWTHWSVVYNLDRCSAKIATLGNYDEIFPYRFVGTDAWKVEKPTTARPTVRTDLPTFDAATAVPGKVYRLADAVSGSSGEPSSFAGASAAVVNRMGCTYDADGTTLHAVAMNGPENRYKAALYVDMASRSVGQSARSVAAGVNEKGLAGRVVKFRNSTCPGDVSPSAKLLEILNGCATVNEAVSYLSDFSQSEGGCGILFSDAMGNVGLWGPAGMELPTDDASELVRNSLDLRKGIYEIDGDGRGEFDELPGLMRLASSGRTQAVISMGYGHLDVMLPETNVVWRLSVPGANVPVYGVIAEPASVPHATMSLARADDPGVATERNNRGQLVAETNVPQKVTYTAEKGYRFPDGSTVWERTFDVTKAVTSVPAPPTPVCRRAPDYTTADGRDWLFNHDIPARRCEGEPAQDPGVDLFYIYPMVVVSNSETTVDGFVDIDDPAMRGNEESHSGGAWDVFCGRVFADFTYVYEPYYRQMTLEGLVNIAGMAGAQMANRACADAIHEGAAYADITNALDCYFANHNHGRPFVLAGQSEGSILLRNVIEHYFTRPENRAKLDRMVACYALGYGVSRDWMTNVTVQTGGKVNLATNATDTGVYVTWNTTGPGATGVNMLVPPNAVAVNPLIWTTNGTPAAADRNLGALTNALTCGIGIHLYDATVDTVRGTVVCTSLPEQEYIHDIPEFGEKSLHYFEYTAWWENLRLNAYQRIETATGRKPRCGTPTDYSASENWMSCPATADKGLDVFYLYPTCVPGTCPMLVGEIEDGMKAAAKGHFKRGPSTFESYANVYAPYYRQGSALALASDLTPDGIQRFGSTHVVKTDVFAALDWYFANRNPGAKRPFILASHSQGSANMKNVLEEYFVGEKASCADNLVAAYILGYKITRDWCEKVGVPFASREDDVRVVLTWNAEGPGATSDNFLTADPNQLAINPISWTTEAAEALRADNLGSVVTNAQGQLYKTGRPGVTGARLQTGRAGAVIVDDPETIPVGTSPGFGTKSYHFEDWGFFHENIGANGFVRYMAKLGASCAFDRTEYVVSEGGEVTVRVRGGSADKAVQVTLTYVENTGAYSAAYLDGESVSFPLTLNWEKGETDPKEILFRTSSSSRVEEDRFFTLQLSAPVGALVLGGHDVCTVTISDSGVSDDSYVRALAWPANAGTVSGAGTLANAKSYRTLKATAKKFATFAGWYKAKADDPNVIDLASPVDPYDSRKPGQIRVGSGTKNGAGTYFAYFTDVLAVAAVVEPQAFDAATGKPLAGVAGVAGQDSANGVYETFVGVKFALPVSIDDDSGKGKLTVKKLPNGLSLRQDRLTKAYSIAGIPTKAGAFAAQFVASNDAGKHTVSYLFDVATIPANAVGTFYGLVTDDEDGRPHRTGVGSVTFTAGKTGALSAKVMRRLSGVRSFSAKGYDYIDANTFGVAMTNGTGEVLEARLDLSGGLYDTTLAGTAFGGDRKGTLGYNREADGTFAAVRSTFSSKDKDPAAQQALATFTGTYDGLLGSTTNELGVATDAVGTVSYRVGANGSVYLAVKIDKSSDGVGPVPAKSMSGSVAGGFLYDEANAHGGCAAALRSGTYLWSTEALFDYKTHDVGGQARYLRPNADRAVTEPVDVDQFVGRE